MRLKPDEELGKSAAQVFRWKKSKTFCFPWRWPDSTCPAAASSPDETASCLIVPLYQLTHMSISCCCAFPRSWTTNPAEIQVARYLLVELLWMTKDTGSTFKICVRLMWIITIVSVSVFNTNSDSNDKKDNQMPVSQPTLLARLTQMQNCTRHIHPAHILLEWANRSGPFCSCSF